MRQILPLCFGALSLLACGGAPPAESPTGASAAASDPDTSTGAADPEAGADGDGGGSGETSTGGQPDPEFNPSEGNTFQETGTKTARSARGVKESKLKATATEAVLKFFVIDKNKDEAVPGIVISLKSPDGKTFYTEETDAKGYAEVLVPVGKTYELVYLSLGERDINAKVPVGDEPNQNVKLTLRYKRWIPKKGPDGKPVAPTFTLDGVTFDTGKAKIRAESFPRLDSVVEYLTHKKSARIQISGHTDNVGKPEKNKALSQKRADACRDYLVKKGIDKSRIEAIGYGDEQPKVSNDTPDGRAQNRRIEAKEL